MINKSPLPTPKMLKSQVMRWWQRGDLQKAYLSETSLLPIRFPLPRLTATQLQAQYTLLRPAINAIVRESKQYKNNSYEIEYITLNHRRLGQQQMPTAIVFSHIEDLLYWIGCHGQYQQFCHRVNLTKQQLPQLIPLIQEKPRLLMQNLTVWSQLLAVCHYFRRNPQPNIYMRELDIAGVDTKFIENHQKVLKQLLDAILPAAQLQDKPNQLAQHGFERRFGLRYPEPLIRFRILDHQLETPDLPITDCTIPLNEFAALHLPCRQVFITENLINGLSFPNVRSAIVIFGLGYGVQSLAKATWLQQKKLYYWGDIDTHGFAILSQLRSYFPQLQSLLMDKATWDQFTALRVIEAVPQRCLKTLAYLTTQEQNLYQALCRLANDVPNRLEQERLPFNYCHSHIRTL